MIKKLLSKLKTNYKEYLTNHLGTNIMLLIATVIYVITDLEGDTGTADKLFVACISTAMFSCLIES